MVTQDITIQVTGPAVLRVRETDTGIEVEQRNEAGENEIVEVAAQQGPKGDAGTPGATGRDGSYERTIFHASVSAPSTPTAPATVGAGQNPTLPNTWAATPPSGTTAIWASVQRVARGATAVTYTTPRRWDGVDGSDSWEVLSQADYDALADKDANTLYLVTA